MDSIKKHGILAVATRYKLLSDKLYTSVDEIFKSLNFDFSARWYLYLSTIHNHKLISVMDLAKELSQSHPAIIQLNKKMLIKNYIAYDSDKSDERKKLIKLSAFGEKQYSELNKIAVLIEKSLTKMDLDYKLNLLKNMEAIESAIQKSSIKDTVLRQVNNSLNSKVEILSYDNKYKAFFKSLNYEWLEKYFYVEEIDATVLSNPKEYIIDKGGQIFFALYKGEVLGTCALIKDKNNFWELTKMAVTEKYQGLKVGEKLAVKVIETFKGFKEGTLYLESNSKLTPAIRLYEKLGFRHLKRKSDSHYQRADVYMVYFEE